MSDSTTTEQLGDPAERDLITLHVDAAGMWRWTWTARNGRVVAASTEGYTRRIDAVLNLERIAGGTVVITYRMRSEHSTGGTYEQGHVSRVARGAADVEHVRIELRVI